MIHPEDSRVTQGEVAKKSEAEKKKTAPPRKKILMWVAGVAILPLLITAFYVTKNFN